MELMPDLRRSKVDVIAIWQWIAWFCSLKQLTIVEECKALWISSA
jgi:hypothetical protein